VHIEKKISEYFSVPHKFERFALAILTSLCCGSADACMNTEHLEKANALFSVFNKWM